MQNILFERLSSNTITPIKHHFLFQTNTLLFTKHNIALLPAPLLQIVITYYNTFDYNYDHYHYRHTFT